MVIWERPQTNNDRKLHHWKQICCIELKWICCPWGIFWICCLPLIHQSPTGRWLIVAGRYQCMCDFCLTINVPGDCGSSRPMRVEPRLHCVGIEWQVWGRCVGSAAHSRLHEIAARALSAARAIEPRPTRFAWVLALGVPRTHNTACALCVGPRTLRGFAHFAWARAFCVGSRTFQPALGGPCIDILFHTIFNPFNMLFKQITPNII